MKPMLFKMNWKTQGTFAAVIAGALLTTTSVGWAGEGHGLSFGHVGSPDEVDRTVQIEASDIAFDHEKIHAKPGETIRFVITNTGQMPHDFTLGPPSVQKSHREEMRQMMQSSDMGHGDGGHGHGDGHHGDNSGHGHGHGSSEHNDPNAVMVQPGETKELIWHFKKVSGIKFACNVPGHHKAGMHGHFNQGG